MNLLLSCPPVYHLPGTWTECKEPLIHHFKSSTWTCVRSIHGTIGCCPIDMGNIHDFWYRWEGS